MTKTQKSQCVDTLNERIRLLEATLKLIAYPERQDDYTPQQLARHALRIEPLRPIKTSTD